MYRHCVKSSNLEEVGYDPATRTLQVRFTSGGTYDYADVPTEAYMALIQADSKGRYLQAHIKGQYDVSRVPEEPEAP